MFTSISHEAAAALIAAQLSNGGAFLCVGGETPNVMTIGWGGLTYFWQRDVMLAPVRPQRFTHDILRREKAFTVCVPAQGTMQDALRQAGTLTGRDGDKFRAIGVAPLAARTVSAPVIPGCALVLECRLLSENAFTREGTEKALADRVYPAGDYHTLFFGEITACYAGDET